MQSKQSPSSFFYIEIDKKWMDGGSKTPDIFQFQQQSSVLGKINNEKQVSFSALPQ